MAISSSFLMVSATDQMDAFLSSPNFTTEFHDSDILVVVSSQSSTCLYLFQVESANIGLPLTPVLGFFALIQHCLK